MTPRRLDDARLEELEGLLVRLINLRSPGTILSLEDALSLIREVREFRAKVPHDL